MIDVGIQSTRICQCSDGYLSLTVCKAKKGVEGARTIFMENCGLVLLHRKFHFCPPAINTLKPLHMKYIFVNAAKECMFTFSMQLANFSRNFLKNLIWRESKQISVSHWQIRFFFPVPLWKKEMCLLPIQENLTTEGYKTPVRLERHKLFCSSQTTEVLLLAQGIKGSILTGRKHCLHHTGDRRWYTGTPRGFHFAAHVKCW